MAGGRKTKAEELDLAGQLANMLPEIGDTRESIRAYAKALAGAMVAGACSANLGKELREVANLALRSLRKDPSDEINELRDLTERAEAVQKAGFARAAADRQHRRTPKAKAGADAPVPAPVKRRATGRGAPHGKKRARPTDSTPAPGAQDT